MTQRIIFLTAILLSQLSIAQQFVMENGINSSSFRFNDGISTADLPNLRSANNSYLSFGYRHSLLEDNKLFVNAGITYTGYGAIGSDRDLDNFYEWDVNYLGIKLGIEYQLFKIGQFEFFANASISGEQLIQGNQTINNQVYNVIGIEEFNNPALFYRGGVSLVYPFYRILTASLTYQIGESLPMKFESSELKLISRTVHLGLLIDIIE